MALSDVLRLHFPGSCIQACRYVDSLGSLQEAWDATTRGDWLMFTLGYLSGDEPYSDARRVLTRLICDVCKLSVEQSRHAEKSTEAIDFAQAWGFGDPDKTQAEIEAYMAAMLAEETEERIEETFLLPLEVIIETDREVVGSFMAAAATTYAGLTNFTWGLGDFESERLLRVANIVRSHYPQAPDVPEVPNEEP